MRQSPLSLMKSWVQSTYLPAISQFKGAGTPFESQTIPKPRTRGRACAEGALCAYKCHIHRFCLPTRLQMLSWKGDAKDEEFA